MGKLAKNLGLALIFCATAYVMYHYKLEMFTPNTSEAIQIDCLTEKIGIWGGDLAFLKDKTMEECQIACNEHEKCNYWTYALGPKYLPSRTCILKTVVIDYKKHGSLISGKSGCEVQQPLDGNQIRTKLAEIKTLDDLYMDCEENGIGIWGADLKTIGNIRNKDKCVELCDADETCKYYTYAFAGGALPQYTCMFKSHVHQRKKDNTMVSGRANCDYSLKFQGVAFHDDIDNTEFTLALDIYQRNWEAFGDYYRLTIEISEDGKQFTFVDQNTKMVGILENNKISGEVFQDGVGGGAFNVEHVEHFE